MVAPFRKKQRRSKLGASGSLLAGVGHARFGQTNLNRARRMPHFQPFATYEQDAANWITLATGEFYPDVLKDACELYAPVIALFGHLLKRAADSKELFTAIADTKDGWTRIQMARVFKRYVSPPTPVEMLKQKTKAPKIIKEFGDAFRPIAVVQKNFLKRPIPDEALSALLWEYK